MPGLSETNHRIPKHQTPSYFYRGKRFMRTRTRKKIRDILKIIPNGTADTSEITNGFLVLEGGAQRCIYSMGVLDVFMKNGLNIMNVVGVSAGALSGVSYMAGNIGEAARFMITHSADTKFIGIGAGNRDEHSRGGMINYSLMTRESRLWDHLTVGRLEDQRRRFISVVTNVRTGEAEYLEKSDPEHNMIEVQASASFPLMAPPVRIDGNRYLDGGVRMQIPYRYALDQNDGPVVVIRTNPSDYRAENNEIYVNRVVQKFERYPEFCDAVRKNVERYNEQCGELEELAADGSIFMLAPDKNLSFHRFTRNPDKLLDGYIQGYRDAEKNLNKIKEFLKNNK